MSIRDLLEPTGPQRPLRPQRPSTVYQIAPDAHPRRIHRSPDGTLMGEVPVVPVAPDDRDPREQRDAREPRDARDRRSRRAPQPRRTPPRAAADDTGDDRADPSVRRQRAMAVRDVEGFDLRPDPLEAATPAEFVEAMRRYRRWAGNPSYRTMATNCGYTCSSAAFHAVLKGEGLPKFTQLNAFVIACGGDESEFQRWATAWRKLDQARQAAAQAPGGAPSRPAAGGGTGDGGGDEGGRGSRK
ncbi:hypothetical protein HNR23_002020 [Nocardiopsis mwathae]|uniref:XRE family transcriptional regulator n=1 Tax=Nocardiopsis mwathae TaxID=1472723 RepID=A0A7W9YHC1_9ACTN|nr:hypothetical protein [Nocardiopsis mwathae]MBB6171960.1 hypothetical protein [Nocardiopsis mwathae]